MGNLGNRNPHEELIKWEVKRSRQIPCCKPIGHHYESVNVPA